MIKYLLYFSPILLSCCSQSPIPPAVAETQQVTQAEAPAPPAQVPDQMAAVMNLLQLGMKNSHYGIVLLSCFDPTDSVPLVKSPCLKSIADCTGEVVKKKGKAVDLGLETLLCAEKYFEERP